jgi:uncharacterized membrane protein YfcA
MVDPRRVTVSIEILLGVGVAVFLIAFSFAPIGMGGGMLFVPLLHYGAGWAIDGRTIAVSLMLTAVVSYGSGIAHRREGFVDDAVVKIGLLWAVPGALVGVVIVSAIGSHLDIVFKSASLLMIIWAIRRTVSKLTPSSNQQNQNTSQNKIQILPLRLGAAIGGTLSSVLAIGAGVIYVPILRTFAHLSPRDAVGSSLHFMMVVIPISIITHLAFLSKQNMDQLQNDWAFISCLGFLTFLGARSGALFGIKRLSEQRIMQMFLFIMILVALRYAFDIATR